MFVNTGDYIEHKNDAPLLSIYYTFTPRPLMDGGFFTMDYDLASLLTAVYRSIGILEGIILSLPEMEAFADLMQLKESCFSKIIDYPDFDIYSYILDRGLGKSNDEINNIASAYHHVSQKNTDRTSFDNIARFVFHGINSNKKVHTRSSQIFLSKAVSNYRQYNPTAPADIHQALNDIFKYVENDGTDPIIKAAMCHYQFEMIHPYEYYNGVVGRLLVYKMLHNAGLIITQHFSLSEFLYKNKEEYFKKLGLTQKEGSYSVWIEFFIRVIYDAVQHGIRSVQTYISIIKQDEEKLAGKNSRHLVNVYDYFKKNLVSSVNESSAQLQISFIAASRAIETLQSIGILKQIISQSRNRLFAHADLMRLFLSEQE